MPHFGKQHKIKQRKRGFADGREFSMETSISAMGADDVEKQTTGEKPQVYVKGGS